MIFPLETEKHQKGEIFNSNFRIRNVVYLSRLRILENRKRRPFRRRHVIGYKISRDMSLFFKNACAITWIFGKQIWRTNCRPKDQKIRINLKQYEEVVVDLAVEKLILLPTVVTAGAMVEIEVFNCDVDSLLHVRDQWPFSL